MMKMRKAISLSGLALLILTACNLSASGKSPTIAWNSLRDTPVFAAETDQIHQIATPSASPSTPTGTPTPTANPLAISRLAAGSGIDILRLEMLDTQKGWGIGGPKASGNSGHVFRTADGGTTWSEVTPPEIASTVSDLDSMAAVGYFRDPQTGWVTYHAIQPSAVPTNPVVWKTVDGGRTWQASSPLSTADLMETYSVSHIVFSDAQNGWVLAHVGAGMNHDYIALYRTSDGGGNWSRVIDPQNDGGIQSCTKTGLAFSDGAKGWLSGDCNGVRPGAFLFTTQDGGSHWDPVVLPAPVNHPDLFTADQFACKVRAPFLLHNLAYLGVECADMSAADGSKIQLLYRATSGTDLLALAYPGGDIFTLDGTRIWALGREIFRSDNSGTAWSKVSSVTWDGKFDFVTSELGWAAVHKDSEYGLVRTSNGGGLWEQIMPVIANNQ